MNPQELAVFAGRLALRGCGHTGTSATAPPAVAAYAQAFAAAVGGAAADASAGSGTDWTGASPEAIARALGALIADGLLPGRTGYLYLKRGGKAPEGKPSPQGRLAMARAAGAAVSAVAVGRGDVLGLSEAGTIAVLRLDPDARPAAWDDVRGVAVHVESLATGSLTSFWVSRADLASRKAKSSGSSWAADAIGMACTKAVSIMVARGGIPQASLLPAILGASAHAARPEQTVIEATAPRQIAPPPAPAAEPEQAPPVEPEAEAQPEAQAGPTWDDVIAEIIGAEGDPTEDEQECARSVLTKASASAAAKGRTLTPETCLSPAALSRLRDTYRADFAAM